MQGGTARGNAGYGRGVVELDELAQESAGHAEDIAERLSATFRSPHYTPPLLPAAAVEVHRMTQQQDVQLEQILSVLEKDPLLAARVLKVASSPVYGGQLLQSLQHGVMRLGMRQLAALVWEVALNMRVFRSKSYEAPMEAVRRHSIACAHVARAVAKHTAVPLEYAFLCGLLHDVGVAAALHLLGEGGSNRGKPLDPEVLSMVLSQSHAEASQLVARLWLLPDDVQLVLRHHHEVTMQGYAHPTAAVIAIAERTMAELGACQAVTWDVTSEHALLAARDALRLSQRSLEAIKTEADTILVKLEHSE